MKKWTWQSFWRVFFRDEGKVIKTKAWRKIYIALFTFWLWVTVKSFICLTATRKSWIWRFYSSKPERSYGPRAYNKFDKFHSVLRETQEKRESYPPTTLLGKVWWKKFRFHNTRRRGKFKNALIISFLSSCV